MFCVEGTCISIARNADERHLQKFMIEKAIEDGFSKPRWLVRKRNGICKEIKYKARDQWKKNRDCMQCFRWNNRDVSLQDTQIFF